MPGSPRPTLAQANRAIANLKLDKIRKEAMKRYRWSAKTASEAELWYRRFLTLRARHGARVVGIGKHADKLWHMHMLDSRKYAADSQRVFGGYLHHAPIYGRPTAAHKAQLTQTKAMYVAAFGKVAPDFGILCH